MTAPTAQADSALPPRQQATAPLGSLVIVDGNITIPATIKTLGWTSPDPQAEKYARDNDHVFPKQLTREFNTWLNEPDGFAYWLWGHTGCGKTTFVKQFMHRLNWGVYSVTCSASTEVESFFGQYTLVKGSMDWIDGPLLKAIKNGGVFLLNEADTLNPEEFVKLYDLLEALGTGNSIGVDQLGIHIEPHLYFRVVVTANTNGAGDESGYLGTQMQSPALMERFMVAKLGYMAKEHELALLQKVCSIPKDILSRMVDLANKVRDAFASDQDSDQRCNLPFSTRSLLQWAKKYEQLGRHEPDPRNRLPYALDLALLRKGRTEDVLAIETMAKSIFGLDAWRD